jgi:hypothetical protein
VKTAASPTFTISWFGLGHQNPGIADPAELGLKIYAATEPAKPESYGFPVHFVIHLRSLSYGGQVASCKTGMRSPTNGRHTPRKGYPVRRGLSIPSLTSRNIGSPAFAGVRDDRDTPLEWDETVRVLEVIWVKREAEYFCK